MAAQLTPGPLTADGSGHRHTFSIGSSVASSSPSRPVSPGREALEDEARAGASSVAAIPGHGIGQQLKRRGSSRSSSHDAAEWTKPSASWSDASGGFDDAEAALPMSAKSSQQLNISQPSRDWVPSPISPSPAPMQTNRRHFRDPSEDIGQLQLAPHEFTSPQHGRRRISSSADLYGMPLHSVTDSRSTHISATTAARSSSALMEPQSSLSGYDPEPTRLTARGQGWPTENVMSWSQISLDAVEQSEGNPVHDASRASSVGNFQERRGRHGSRWVSDYSAVFDEHTVDNDYRGRSHPLNARATSSRDGISSSRNAYDRSVSPMRDPSMMNDTEAFQLTDIRARSSDEETHQRELPILQQSTSSQYFSHPGSSSPSRISRKKSLLATAKRELKRVSTRVVNLRQRATNSDERHVRLPDLASSSDSDDSSVDSDKDDSKAATNERALPSVPNSKAPPSVDDAHEGVYSVQEPINANALRGRSLGVFGPNHPIRRIAFDALAWTWTEPLLLLLIILDIVVLTIQSAPSTYDHPRYRGPGYFHKWEDFVLFVLFCLFSLETFARILVNGFILDSVDTGLWPSQLAHVPVDQTYIRPGGVKWWLQKSWQGAFGNSDNAKRLQSGSVTRGANLTQSEDGTLRQPFENGDGKLKLHNGLPDLAHSPNALAPPQHELSYRSGSQSSVLELSDAAGSNEVQAHARGKRSPSPASLIYPPPPTSAPSTIRSFRSTQHLISQNGTAHSGSKMQGQRSPFGNLHEDVPFVRAILAQRHQNLLHKRAYLRHSWNRVDFIAVVGFWICFLLSITGVEGREHLYLFRALSTLRAARLLTITAGTTVSQPPEMSAHLKHPFLTSIPRQSCEV